MKTLTTAAIILSLSLSGSAFAINATDTQHYNDFYPSSSLAARTGSQPEVGSVFQSGSLSTGSSNFWQENGKLLDRHSNEVDSSDISGYVDGRTGSQPEIGSVALGGNISAGSGNFWAENKELMYRNNPLR